MAIVALALPGQVATTFETTWLDAHTFPIAAVDSDVGAFVAWVTGAWLGAVAGAIAAGLADAGLAEEAGLADGAGLAVADGDAADEAAVGTGLAEDGLGLDAASVFTAAVALGLGAEGAFAVTDAAGAAVAFD